MKLEKPMNEDFNTTVENARNDPKWAQKGRPYNIPCKDFAFIREEIDGKYGKQVVYIVDSKEVGYLFVNPQDFLRLASRIADSRKMHPSSKNEPEYIVYTFE